MVNFNITLFEPEIPQNTGSIGRLCVSTGCKLHLIEPLGFSLEDKYLKRAGMDYWNKLDYTIYPNWDKFMQSNPDAVLHFFSTHGTTSFYDVEYSPGDYLVFGKESAGLPQEFYEKYRDRMRIIPMPGEFFRSINLANSVSIALYEAMRQNRTVWDKSE
ncbi:MAG: tRNA (cytidine(34)-2'-O)-methyltransferase [Lentisphaeria bacterium]|nr:tRNA (cytidine(34)-2'-O)-methyltransferase [Lentisphaeria bacterium]MBR7119732.1 tRNA (cytidine(34)-2'-O)-methyltransferase [Lentisphaeria bacterium]